MEKSNRDEVPCREEEEDKVGVRSRTERWGQKEEEGRGDRQEQEVGRTDEERKRRTGRKTKGLRNKERVRFGQRD